MGRYVTRTISDKEYKKLINTIRKGYNDGHDRRPNPQIATILILQANLGCRIGDIVALRTDSIIYDGDAYKLDIREEKTGKSRPFVVPTPVKRLIDDYIEQNRIVNGRLFSVSEAAVWKCLRQATAYLGMENVSAHSLRKAAALRVYVDSGYDIVLTSNFLNHSSAKTTMLYLKRSSKQMDNVLSKSVMLA